MASYMVAEPPGSEARDEAVFIRDGFRFWAFLVPLIWFLCHRMWREAMIVLAATIAAAAALSYAGYPGLVGWAFLLIGLCAGLEAPALRLAALERDDWSLTGIVEADTLQEAEMRYLAEAAAAPQPSPDPAVLAPWGRPSPHARHSGGAALGLFGYPGSR